MTQAASYSPLTLRAHPLCDMTDVIVECLIRVGPFPFHTCIVLYAELLRTS